MGNEILLNNGEDIVRIESMADGLRNTGYKSIYNALAEIVDNSIEENASNVFIIGTQDLFLNQQIIRKYAVLDDGSGMDENVLSKCLQIGFSTRRERKGIGRFGVGLPQASYYASPRVEVYSWVDGIENCRCVYIDLDMVTAKTQTKIVGPYPTDIPEEYKPFIHFEGPDGKKYDFSKHGTLVVWPRCDKQDPKRWNTCRRNLSEDLGRKYRWMINDGSVEIATIESTDFETFEVILPNDPLFLMSKSQNCVKINCGDEDNECGRYNEVKGLTETIFEPFITEENNTGVVDYPVYYIDKAGNKVNSTVKIRFSIVKDIYYDKQYIASDPGDLRYGKAVKKNDGISIVRQGREIDFGTFGFYEVTNSPHHRWWGCEISFTSELDEAFGISNNKQQVDLRPIDTEALQDYEGNEPMWAQLNKILKKAIADMVKKNKGRRSGSRSGKNGSTATTATSEVIKKSENENPDIVVSIPPTTLTQEELNEKVIRALEDEGFIDVTQEQINQFLDSNTRIKYVNHGKRNAFLDLDSSLEVLQIIINKDHEFYQTYVIESFTDEKMQLTFELFIAALVKSVFDLQATHPKAMEKLIDSLNRMLKVYLDNINCE